MQNLCSQLQKYICYIIAASMTQNLTLESTVNEPATSTATLDQDGL